MRIIVLFIFGLFSVASFMIAWSATDIKFVVFGIVAMLLCIVTAFAIGSTEKETK